VAPIEGQNPTGSGSIPRFALFATTSDATTDLLREFNTLLEPDIRPPLNTDGIWLVRPDGYAACVARNDQMEIIVDYLNSVV
jgi:hypothetical protein